MGALPTAKWIWHLRLVSPLESDRQFPRRVTPARPRIVTLPLISILILLGLRSLITVPPVPIMGSG